MRRRWLDSGGAAGAAHALDVGTGCGVVAMMLLQARLRVTATDINPAAVRTAQAVAQQQQAGSRFEAVLADIVPPALSGVDLVVWNPPWLPPPSDGSAGASPIDRASYASPELMPRFFAAAHNALRPGGRAVVVWSNFAEAAGLADPSDHPVSNELSTGGRFVLREHIVERVPRGGRLLAGREPRWKAKILTRLNTELWVLERPLSQPYT